VYVVQFTGTDTTLASTTQSVVIDVTSNTSQSPTLAAVPSIAQIASAGGWDTSLTLVNLGATPAQGALDFFDDSGNPLSLPFTFPQGSISPTTTSTFNDTIDAHGLLLMDTTGPVSQAVNVGWSFLQTSGNVSGYAVFTNTPNDWQAAVPLEALNASSYLLAFDNTGSLSTGLAIANLSPHSANINVIIRNDGGATIGTEIINVPGQGHTSFMLNSTYPVTADIRGTIELDTPAGGQINVLGLRANGPALTTVPVLAGVSTSGGSMAHVTYNEGWQTTFTLVNTGASTAQATLSFFDDNGAPLPMSLTFVQTGAVSTSATVTEELAAGASLIVQTNGQGSSPSVSGSAQLTTTGNVSGFAVFRYDPSHQEAVVPLETRNATSYTLVFDNTQGIVTGMALANESGRPVTLNLVLRNDSGAQIGAGSVSLEGHGHTAVILSQEYAATAGIRGTVEIDGPAGSQFSALGIRFTPSQNITTIPVLTN
jgi:hypothetical protein